MNIIRFIFALLLGLLIGSAVNMGLILISGKVIPPPAGADATTMEGLKASIHLFRPQHFLFPFLAHALGTLVGAFTAARLTAVGRTSIAFIVGGLFMAGGIINCFLLPAPAWFIVTDLVAAYLPMAWIGRKLAPA